jgi:transcriptional regulator with XRE-family HTH domain/tetratricopeptide (TPR) repeat protein
MSSSVNSSNDLSKKPPSGDANESFGSYLRFLRRRAQLTQTELSVAVGYSPGQISMLESGQRHPNVTAVMALFIAALGLQPDSQAANRLIALARATIERATPASALLVSDAVEWRQEELGLLEEIPPLPTCFVERADANAHVAQWLKRERWAAICGLPGMGKSTLAASLAHSHAAQHPIFWLSFGHGLNQTPEDLLRQLGLFAMAFGTPAVRSALLRRIASGETPGPLRQQLFHVAAALNTLRSPLLVFDDVHLVIDKGEMREILQGVREQAPYSRALYCTREELALPGLPHLTLQGLQPSEALKLVTALGAQAAPSGGERGDDVAARFTPLFSQSAGNPLLLRLAVGHLPEGNTRSAILGQKLAHPLVMEVAEQLTPDARWLLDWLVVWQNVIDLTDPTLAAWLATQRAGYLHAAAVEQLRRKRMIDRDTHAFLHPLLHEPLLAALNVQPSQHQTMHRLAAAWAEAKIEGVKAAHHWSKVGDLSRACTLLEGRSESATSSAQAKAQTHAAAAVIDEVLAQARRLSTNQSTAQPAGDSGQSLIARLLALRGDLLINTLRANEARANYRAAIDLTLDPLVRAHLAQRLALSLLRIGHAQDALYLCEDALGLLKGNESGEAMRLRLQLGGVLGRAYIAVGRLDDSAAFCQAGLEAARTLRLTKPTLAEKIAASARLGLGYVCRRQANNEEARIHFERAVMHARTAEAHNEEVEALGHLSVTLRELGDFAGAEKSGQQALEIAQRVGNDFLAATLLHRLSITSYYHNELKLALERSEGAVALQRQMGDAGGMVLCDSLQAVVMVTIGALAEAAATIKRARQESNLLDNNWLQGLVLYVFGIVHTLNGELRAAEQALRAALSKDDYVKDLPMREGVLIFLGINAIAQGNLAEAHRIEAMLAENVPIETELLGGLFRGMAAIVAGEGERARTIATTIRQRAQASGYLIYAYEADRLLMAVEDPPLTAQLPAFVCLHLPMQNHLSA